MAISFQLGRNVQTKWFNVLALELQKKFVKIPHYIEWANHGIMGRRFPDGVLLRYRK